MKKLYITLLVINTSTQKEITISYRKLAMKYHPDRAESYLKKLYEEKFKEVTFAYSILGDILKRQRYDKYGITDDTIIIEEQEEILRGFNEDYTKNLDESKQDNFCRALNREGAEEKCTECDGSGIAEYEKGFFLIEETCKKCKGEGYIRIKEKGYINDIIDDYLSAKILKI